MIESRVSMKRELSEHVHSPRIKREFEHTGEGSTADADSRHTLLSRQSNNSDSINSVLAPPLLPNEDENAKHNLAVSIQLRAAYTSFFAQLPVQPCLALDVWRAPTGIYYLEVIAVFLNDFDLHSLTLGMTRVRMPPSQDELRGYVSAVCETYNIQPLSYVTDTVRTQLSLAEALALWGETECSVPAFLRSLLPDGLTMTFVQLEEISHFYLAEFYDDTEGLSQLLRETFQPNESRSMCHSLEITIHHLLKPAKQYLASLRQFAVRLSGDRMLRGILQSHNIRIPFIPRDVPTHWTSTYRMIEAFLTHRSAIATILACLKHLSTLESNSMILQFVQEASESLTFLIEEYPLFEFLYQTLNPVITALSTLHGNSYLTLNFIPKILDDLGGAGLPDSESLVAHEIEAIAPRIVETHFDFDASPKKLGYIPNHLFACYLDPKYRRYANHKKHVIKELYWQMGLMATTSQFSRNGVNCLREEILRYDMGRSESDAATFWKQYDSGFLKQMARRYLQYPASPVTLERMFSSTGLIFDTQRERFADPSFDVQGLLRLNHETHLALRII